MSTTRTKRCAWNAIPGSCLLHFCLLLVLGVGWASAAEMEDLVLYLPFEDAQNPIDASDDPATVSVHGTLNSVDGQFGAKGAEFDGMTANRVEVGDTAKLDGMTAVTIEAWIRTRGLALQEGMSVASKRVAFGNGDVYNLFVWNGDIVNARINGNGGSALLSTTALQDDTWYHLAFSFDGESTGDKTNLYVNGVLEASGGHPDGAVNAGGAPVWIGELDAARGFAWNGVIDEVGIWNVALAEEEINDIMVRGKATLFIGGRAGNPVPADSADDVPHTTGLSWAPGEFAATRDVYFGTQFDDINNAGRVNPLEALASEGQTGTTLDPGRLAFGETYYWRVDEVNGAPDFTIHRGDIWSFTTEPLSIPITGITATASSSFGASGPEKTIDGSGLVDDLHDVFAGDMWISGGIPATLEYAFDRAYKLHELWIWNSNQVIEAFVGFGAKDVVIEHSLDGANWTVLDGVGPLAQAPGTADYAHNNTIDFGGATAQHVRVTVNSVQGIAPQASLSEVRFFFIPTFATRPNPDSGATNVAPDTALSWGRSGREADRHEVHVGTDASDLPLAGNVGESSFPTGALDLQLGQTYSWRVDEVNDTMDPSTWQGTVWSFTTADTVPIDDMERYRDEEFLEIWATWVDGFDDPAKNGSLVGNGASGSPETGTVHSGSQSLPLHFDNRSASISEATRTFDAPMDWTGHGVQNLVLSFSRGAENTGGGRLYVKVNDTKVVHPQDPGTLPPGWDAWTQWNVDLTVLGTDLTQVRSLTLGIEGAGANGVLYVDDIQLEGAGSESGSQPLTWFEAEAADILGASWQVVADPTASGGNRIGSEDGDGDDNNTAPGAEWVAAYTFTVPVDGVYGLVLRAQEATSDSFWVRIVGATSQSHEDPDQPGTGWVLFNEIDAPGAWSWDQVHSFDHGNAVVSWTLPAGPLTLEIAKREDGTHLDAIAVIQ